MAFGKKAVGTAVKQSDVSMLASEALKKQRACVVRLAMRITGETPILMHRWGQKAIMEMVGKAVGQPQPRGAKDLTAEYEESYYRNLDNVVALPCRIIKACIIEGAIATNGVVTKADLKRGLRVLGYTTPIHMKGGAMRMDCRIASNNGTPDMRSRAVIPEGWSCDVVLQFPSTLTPDKVVAAFDAAGASIGLCDWRPERGGDYGTFSIEALPDSEQDRILKDCAVPEKEYVIPPEFLKTFASTLTTSDPVRKVQALVEKTSADAAHERTRSKSNGRAHA